MILLFEGYLYFIVCLYGDYYLMSSLVCQTPRENTEGSGRPIHISFLFPMNPGELLLMECVICRHPFSCGFAWV